MRRTGPGILIATAAVALAGGFLVNQLLTATGHATFTPLITLPVLLIALGAIVVVLAIPVWRASRGHTRAPINPFRALRIAMLAKASSLLGATFLMVVDNLARTNTTSEIPLGILTSFVGAPVFLYLILSGGTQRGD